MSSESAARTLETELTIEAEILGNACDLAWTALLPRRVFNLWIAGAKLKQ